MPGGAKGIEMRITKASTFQEAADLCNNYVIIEYVFIYIKQAYTNHQTLYRCQVTSTVLAKEREQKLNL